MKKKLVTTILSTILVSMFYSEHPADALYLSGNLGFSGARDSDWTDTELPGTTVNVEFKTGLALGAAVGVELGSNIRAEVEAAYQKNDLDKVGLSGVAIDYSGDLTSLTWLANGYFDFPNRTQLTPYLSAGAGISRVDANNWNFSGSGVPDSNASDTVFAWQAGFGAGFAVTRKISIDLKYRYFATSELEFGGTSNVTYSSHNIYVGARVSF